MPANLENSPVAKRQEKVSSFQSQREAMPKNVQTTAQLHSSHMLAKSCSTFSKLHEWRTFRHLSWIQKRQRNQRSNSQHSLDHRRSKRIPVKHLLCFIDYTKAFDCVDHNKLWKILKEMNSQRENTRPPYLPPEKSIRRLRNNSQNRTWNNRLVPNQERSTLGLLSRRILSSCLFNLHAEYIM